MSWKKERAGERAHYDPTLDAQVRVLVEPDDDALLALQEAEDEVLPRRRKRRNGAEKGRNGRTMGCVMMRCTFVDGIATAVMAAGRLERWWGLKGGQRLSCY